VHTAARIDDRIDHRPAVASCASCKACAYSSSVIDADTCPTDAATYGNERSSCRSIDT
jgi:hypothetical protein